MTKCPFCLQKLPPPRCILCGRADDMVIADQFTPFCADRDSCDREANRETNLIKRIARRFYTSFSQTYCQNNTYK